ncbi:hypothetical protein IWQ57_001642 [Coemansia nantahalensis]|uniref:Uncharacterized protein n=1 Tax=Coemansia nantahalensis TaxID=2789366 RepID=A0ACC1K389_9FUNG|nr:hypothetical protein IWQ57_001642 [Coemansia nantahalensis]
MAFLTVSCRVGAKCARALARARALAHRAGHVHFRTRAPASPPIQPYIAPTPSAHAVELFELANAHAAELRAADEAAQAAIAQAKHLEDTCSRLESQVAAAKPQFDASWAEERELNDRMRVVEDTVVGLVKQCTAAENALAAATRTLATAPPPADAPADRKNCLTSTVSTTSSIETLVPTGQAQRPDALAYALASANAATRAQEERTAHLEAEIKQVRRYLRWGWLPQLRCVHRKQIDMLLDLTDAANEHFFDLHKKREALCQPL